MRFFQLLAFVVLVNAVLQMFLPWWVIAPVAIAGGYLFKQNTFFALMAGFAGVFLLWAGYAFYLDAGNNHILSTKVAQVLAALTGGSRITLIMLTGVVGGLVSGLGALSGTLFANVSGK